MNRGARGSLLEAFAVAAEHLDVGEQMMRERDGLRALQMRIAGHDRREVAPREANQRGAKFGDQRDHGGQLVAQIQPQVERDLIVARTPGVQLAPGLADQRDQPALDREVDVFIGNVEFEQAPLDLIFDTLESADDRTHFAGLEQADFREHLRMRDRSANIVPKKPPVKRQRRRE